MKPSFIIALVLAIGVGVALGVFIVPSQHALFSSASPAAATSTNSISGAPGSASPSVPGVSAPPDLDTILADTDPVERENRLEAYAKAVPDDKIPDAARELSNKFPMEENPAINALINRWVAADPEGARAAIATAPDLRIQYLLTRDVFQSLGNGDAAGALQLAKQLPTDRLRVIAQAMVMDQAAKQDPAAAFKLASAAKLESPALGAIFTHWAERDLNQATQALAQVQHAEDRSSAVGAIAVQLMEKDPAGAVSWLDGLPPGYSDGNVRQVLVSRWAHSDPRAASDYVRALQDVQPDLVPNLAYSLVSTWSGTDPKAAVTWVQSLQGLQGQTKSDTLRMAFGNWIHTDPKSAAAFLSSANLDDNTASWVASGMVTEWMKNDSQAAMAWVNQLPDGLMRNSALNATSQELARQDPAKAAANLATMPEGMQKMNAVGAIAVQWAKDDPAAAAQWAANQNLTNPQQTFFVYNTIAGYWATSDPEKASAWLMQLPKGDGRDSAIEGFSNVITKSDPNAALQWASSISNDDARQIETAHIYKRWLQSDPAKAQDAIQHSNLTSDQKSDILENGPLEQ